MRRLTWLAVTAVTIFAASIPAFAGGAVWHFEGYHQPGDVVESTTAVAWGHNSQLGTPEDGPYLIYLAPEDVAVSTWPGFPEEGLLVGIVEVYEGPYTLPHGESYGPNHAVARFEIPADVSPGRYQIFHCNDPCTSALGDIVGGWDLRITRGDGGRPADVIAAEVRERLGDAPLLYPAPTAGAAVESATSTSVDRTWFWVVGAVGVLFVVHMVWPQPTPGARIVIATADDQTEVLR